jgi:hypothetical protein
MSNAVSPIDSHIGSTIFFLNIEIITNKYIALFAFLNSTKYLQKSVLLCLV